MRSPLRAPSRLTLFVLPALLALVVSLPAVQGPMMWDDVLLISGDKFVHHVSNVPKAFGRTFWQGNEASAGRFDYYRPLVTVTYILNYALADGWSGPYHLVNSALYAGTAGLLALTVAELGAGAGVGLAAGMLFAAWPAHHENVDFISGRTDLMAALFLLLALLEYHRLRRRNGASPAGLARLALWVGAACFSKEVAYVTPAVFLLYEWSTTSREPHRPAWPRLLAATLPVALAAGVRPLVMAGRLSGAVAAPKAMLTTLIVDSRSLFCPWPLYLNQRFLPENLTHPPLAVILLWALGAALPLWLLRGRAERGAWLATWLLTIPGCSTGIPANRMLYLPSMVLLPLLAWKISRLPWSAGVKAALCATVVALGAAGFVVAGQVWSDECMLFERLVRESPQDSESHNDLANHYYRRALQPGVADSTRRRWVGLSVRQLRNALQLDRKNPLLWFAQGRNWVELGNDSLAVANLRGGLSLLEDPDARQLEAESLTRLGRYAEAESSILRSMAGASRRQDAERWAELGWIRFKQRRYPESVRASARAMQLNPKLPIPAFNRALAWACAGQTDSAQAGYRAALALDTSGTAAEAGLADILDLGAAGDPHAATAGRALLGACEGPGAAPTAWAEPLRAARARAARRWPGWNKLEEETRVRH